MLPRAGGGFLHLWRNNDAPGFPWNGPTLAMGSEGDVHDVVLVADNLQPGELASIRREGTHLKCAARGFVNVHGVVHPRWGASADLPGGAVAAGTPSCVQSVGIHGNFEVVAPLASGGLAHWWRDNGLPARPWHGPTPFGPGTFSAAALIQSDSGNLEVVAVQGSHLQHFWRDPAHVWHGPIAIPGGAVTGQPGFVQASDGTFQVVAPLASGGLGHWIRDSAKQWAGPVPFGGGVVRAVGLIQGNFGAGNLELVARLDSGIDHYFADESAGASIWHGPDAAWRRPVLDPATHGRCDLAFKPGGPSAIHVSTLGDGRAFCFGFGDKGMGPDPGAFVIDPGTGTTASPTTKHHLFCSGHALLPDGRLVIMGGHGDEVKAIHVFDPATVTLSHHDDMPHGRWYPTVTVLPDGRAAVMSGSQHTGPVSATNPVNATVQVFDVTKPAGHRLSAEEHSPSPFSPHYPAGHQEIDLYPWNIVLPDGRLLVHCRNSTRFWHPGTPGHWDAKILKARRKESRTYPGQGTCVMLPLLPEDGYRVRVMAIGGGGVDREVFYQGGHNDDPSTNTVELLDLGKARPGWQNVAAMHHPRVLCDSVMLPDGRVLVVGGSSTGKSDVAVDPVLPTELYDPAADTWTELAPINCPHLYHSTALLLSDGRVMRGGKDGQFQRDPYKYFEHRLELFSPPYLFGGPRPLIASAPAAGGYGHNITIGCPTAGEITRVALIRAGAVTHNFHMDQRYVGLEVRRTTASKLTVTLPPDSKIAPPGAYMLFVVDGAGIPSAGRMIKVG
ncbi:MAG TPA: galactose oxidase-like domain-containing protein [Solirubrobacteraceae bacterium]